MQKYFDYQLVDDINLISRHLDDVPTSKPIVVNCLNPHSFVEALDDPKFYQALKNCDYLLPDGDGICLTMKRYRGVTIKKIAGDDLHKYLLRLLEEEGGKVYYMGSSKLVLSLIKERAANEHPTLKVRTLSPTYCDELSEEESNSIIADINEFKPDLLFVSMTAPKQEKWVEKYHDQLTGVRIIASIGAVFAFYAETVRRAPAWAIRMHIEWLVRLIKEPLRMWRRNFVSTPRFLRWVRHHKEQM